MATDLIDGLIRFFLHHRELAYGILFLGAMFDTLIGFSFFVFGEVFFLAGSILAGMGVLDLGAVILTLYAGGAAGDNLSYYLGRFLSPLAFRRLKTIPVFRRFFSVASYRRSVRFFSKYGAPSVFIGRLLGPMAWITPFLAGQYNVPYRKFLLYDTLGVMLGIGEFIAAGYLFGKHYDVVIGLITPYAIVALFVAILAVIVWYYLKRSGLLRQLRHLIRNQRKRLLYLLVRNTVIFSVISLLLYGLFLGYIFFVDPPESENDFKAPPTYTLAPPGIAPCGTLGTYYRSRPRKIIQPVNVILESDLNLSDILDGDWDPNEIFLQDHVSLRSYLHLIQNKVPPVSSLYLQGKPQNAAYQYHSDSLSQRQHIRFWIFQPAGTSLRYYYGSISYDHGYAFGFYNYFFTPVHRIEKAIDKSREFFRHYLTRRFDLDVQCHTIPTPCRVHKITGDNEPSEEQMYYTDGRILKCRVGKREEKDQ